MANPIPEEIQTVTLKQAEEIIDNRGPVGKYLTNEHYGQTEFYTGIRCTQDGAVNVLTFRKREKCLAWLETGMDE